MGLILRAGVMFAALVILCGMALLAVRGDPALASGGSAAAAFARGPDAAVTYARAPRAVIASAARGEPGGIIQLGLVLLMLLPVIRVAATVALFAAEREWAIAAIAACVLLLLSFGALD